MRRLKTVAIKIQSQLSWKLMASYLIVIMVGIITLTLAAESVVPGAFSRHIMDMERAMGSLGLGSSLQEMEADLSSNFQGAFNEALLISITTAIISAVLVSFFVSRRVVTPIRQMMQASQHIAAGHYQERVDVTSNDELGQLARSFNRMASQLNQTEAMRRDLIANVAHELRTPLTSIKGYMEGLMDGVFPADPSTYQQIYREADRLQRLVNNLQELSRVEANAFELYRQPTNVLTLIRQTADRLRPQFEEKNVTLKLHLPPSLPKVLIDEDRVQQILVNLMGNALQYTPGGGSVTVRAAQQQQMLAITITDTGTGILAEHLPHLFTRFYRVDKSRSRASGGSGIGLTIAKHLVEAHGGRIWADSAGRGQWSTFGFTLPLVKRRG